MSPFVDDFDGQELDTSVWLPNYLPAWSSREQTRASYRMGDSCLTLYLQPGAGHWCPEDHDPPLRVSGIQSGNYSGPVGSTQGQQPFREGLTVKEAQERFEGHLPSGGHLEIRCRMVLSPRSMGALWLAGFDDRAERAGEICVTEVFGKDVVPGESAEVGIGHKQIRDPNLVHDFAAPRLEIDVADFQTYAVDWDAVESVFSVNGEEVRRCVRPPTYPLQLMLGVFDFPEWSIGDDDHLVPELVVDRISGS